MSNQSITKTKQQTNSSVKESKQEQNLGSKVVKVSTIQLAPKTTGTMKQSSPQGSVPRAIMARAQLSAPIKVMSMETGKKEKGISKKYGKHAANYLRRFSPWLRALSDPFCVHGVQIPDPVTTPSSTFTIWIRRTIVANAQGVAAVVFGLASRGYPLTVRGSLVPVMTTGTELILSDAVGMVSPPDADDAHLFGITSGDEPTILYYPQWATVRQLYSDVRVVSAGLRATYTGNFTTAEGTMTIVSAVRGWLREQSEMVSGACSVAILQSHPDACVVSIPKSYGGQCIYKPLDTVSLQYNNVNETVGEDEPVPDSYMGGEMYIAAVGVPPGQAFQVEFCINMEGIVRTNQLDLVQSNVSKYDIVSSETTWNALPEMPGSAPLATSGTGAEVKAPPIMAKTDEKLMQPQHPATEKTIIENVVDGLPGILDKGLKIAEKVTPFLAALL